MPPSILLAAVLATIGAPSVWLLETVPLDAEITSDELSLTTEALRAALSAEIGEEVLFGRDALPSPKEPEPPVAAARDLVRRGEDAFTTFAFARAAAALAEAAAVLSGSLALLRPEEAELLKQARLLEAVAWMEAGQPDASREAFAKLLTLWPELVPDPAYLSPRAKALFREAVESIRIAGTTTLDLRSKPAGATVVIDGRVRGKTPISVPGLTPGVHGLRLVLHGHDTYSEELRLAATTPGRDITLQPSPALAALGRARMAAQRGLEPTLAADDLGVLSEARGGAAIVLAGVARRPEGERVLYAVLWTPGARSAAVFRELVDVRAAAGAIAKGLMSKPKDLLLLPDGMAGLDTDFERALLGVGPGFGRAPVALPLTRRWWFWTAIGGVAAATLTTVLLLGREEPAPASKRVDLVLDFDQ
jgi:hypothetical protein